MREEDQPVTVGRIFVRNLPQHPGEGRRRSGILRTVLPDNLHIGRRCRPAAPAQAQQARPVAGILIDQAFVPGVGPSLPQGLDLAPRLVREVVVAAQPDEDRPHGQVWVGPLVLLVDAGAEKDCRQHNCQYVT